MVTNSRLNAAALATLMLVYVLMGGCLGRRTTIEFPNTASPPQTESPGQRLRLVVGPTRLPCPGEPTKLCLEVRLAPGEPFQALDAPIEGFAYEEGYEYELVVERQAMTTATAGGQGVGYRLVEVVSRHPVGVATGEPSALLEATTWQLVSQRSASGETAAALPNAPATAQFAAGNLAGNTGCNSYNAAYQLSGLRLSIETPRTTLLNCGEEQMAQERALLANLAAVTSYEVTNQTLTLRDAAGRVVATFAAATSAASSASSLVGSVWRWIASYYSNETATVVDDPAKYTLEFGEDGRVRVVADCNTLAGTYQATNGQLKLELNATTLAVCGEASLAGKFVQELDAVATYVMPDAASLVLNMKYDTGDMHFSAAR